MSYVGADCEEVKFGIIIPVFNLEEYLVKCFESILNQSFQNFEVIVVNDGSSDRSAEICNLYSMRDARIRVFHKDNGGVVSARKMGVENSHSTYITFLDGDDTLPPNALQIANDKLQNDNIDILVGAFFWNIGHSSLIRCSQNNLLNREQYIRKLLFTDITPMSGAKYIRKSLFIDDIFNLSDDIFKGEDWIINLRLASRSKTIKQVSEPLYCYNMRQTSVMSTYKYNYIYELKLLNKLYPYYYGLKFDSKKMEYLFLKAFYIPLILSDISYPKGSFMFKKFSYLVYVYKLDSLSDFFIYLSLHSHVRNIFRLYNRSKFVINILRGYV